MAKVTRGIDTFGRRATLLHTMRLDIDAATLPANAAGTLRNLSYIRVNDVLSNVDYWPAHTEVCACCGKPLAVVAGVVPAVKSGDSWKDAKYRKSNARWQETRLTVASPQGDVSLWFCGVCSADAGKLRAALVAAGGNFAALCDDSGEGDVPAHVAAAYDMHAKRAKHAKDYPGLNVGFHSQNGLTTKDAAPHMASPQWPIAAYIARQARIVAAGKASAVKTAKTPAKAATTPAKAAGKAKTPAKAKTPTTSA